MNFYITVFEGTYKQGRTAELIERQFRMGCLGRLLQAPYFVLYFGGLVEVSGLKKTTVDLFTTV